MIRNNLESSLIGKFCKIEGEGKGTEARYEIVSTPQCSEGCWWVCGFNERDSSLTMLDIDYLEII